MNQTTYRNNRPVRSPIQVQAHPAELARQRAQDTQREEHPMRERVRQLCGTCNLTATFSEDKATISTLKTPGLIAVQCVLSKDGQPIGIGHGSSVISRINRATERTVFSCFNGALMSAINSACKTLDVLRLEASDEQAESDKTAFYREAYQPKEANVPTFATDKQKNYLRELISLNCDEAECERWASQIDDLTKEEASEAIQRFAK